MSEKTYELAGIRLTTELIGLKPEGLPQYLARNADLLVHSERPFADYMRMKFREKGIQQQDIFLAARQIRRIVSRLVVCFSSEISLYPYRSDRSAARKISCCCMPFSLNFIRM